MDANNTVQPLTMFGGVLLRLGLAAVTAAAGRLRRLPGWRGGSPVPAEGGSPLLGSALPPSATASFGRGRSWVGLRAGGAASIAPTAAASGSVLATGGGGHRRRRGRTSLLLLVQRALHELPEHVLIGQRRLIGDRHRSVRRRETSRSATGSW